LVLGSKSILLTVRIGSKDIIKARCSGWVSSSSPHSKF